MCFCDSYIIWENLECFIKTNKTLKLPYKKVLKATNSKVQILLEIQVKGCKKTILTTTFWSKLQTLISYTLCSSFIFVLSVVIQVRTHKMQFMGTLDMFHIWHSFLHNLALFLAIWMLVIEQKPISFILHKSPTLQRLKQSRRNVTKSTTKKS